MKRIVIVGGGNMGEALIAGLVRSKKWKPSQITVTDVRPEALRRLKKTYQVGTSPDNRGAVRDATVILLAVKPQSMAQILEDLGPVLRVSQLVLSIAAGIPTEYLERFLPKNVPTIRVMPNTPALVGMGAAGIAAGRWATKVHLKIARGILETVGTVAEVRESDMDAVTAVSGSGPAYVFLLAEMMMEAGQQLGLAPHVADQLVRQTIKGAGYLLSQSHEGPATLRRKVTSPGGTTEAAIYRLEKAGLKKIFAVALKRAADRSKELSRGASKT